jgi:SAM-dependent methyltransferase
MKTYKNLCTQFYDLDKPTAPADDLNFYIEYAKNSNGAIFEPMCGTGRFLIPMLERGFDIEGADASQYMLSVCREKCEVKELKPKLHQQYLQDMAFKNRFALIFIPSGSFGLITDISDAKKCLTILHNHLLPNGKLVFEIETIRAVPNGLGSYQERCVNGRNGEKITLTSVSSYDQENQILQSIGRYESSTNSKKLTVETENFQVRLYQDHEIDEWLREAGFEIIYRYGDYNRRIAQAGDEMIIYVCEKIPSK